MLTLLFSLAMALAADCPDEGVDEDRLQQLLKTAESQWRDLEVDGYLGALGRVDRLLPCLRKPISAPLAAELHRHVGLKSFLDQEAGNARAAFASARALDPDYRFPDSLVPEGNPVLALYLAQDPAEGPAAPLPPPAKGTLYIDGAPAEARPVARPVVFQHLLDDGSSGLTAYLLPAHALPPYPEKGPGRERSASGPQKVLAAVALASGGVAALTWGGSWVSRGRYNAASEPEDLQRLYKQTNGLVAASAGAAVVATGAGAAAVFAGRF